MKLTKHTAFNLLFLCAFGKLFAQNVPQNDSLKKHHVLLADVGMSYQWLPTTVTGEIYTMGHEWHYFPPRLGVIWMQQKKELAYRTFSISINALPNFTYRLWTDAYNQSGVTYEDTFYLRSRALEVQGRIGFRKYFRERFNGLYWGMNSGLSGVFYRFQTTDLNRETNIPENTVTVTELSSIVKSGTSVYLSFSANLGGSIPLKNGHRLDVGARSSLFLRFISEILIKLPKTEADYKTNIALMNKKALHSRQILEFYVAYSIFQ